MTSTASANGDAEQPPTFQPRSRRAVAKPARRYGWISWLREVVIVLLLALLISTLLRQFVVQVFSIPSESMVSTLRVGDRILVSRLPGSAGSVERGDVVVFADSLQWMEPTASEDGSFLRPVGEFLGVVPGDGNQIIVKRVIGTGGDTVECCTPEGQLTVNGQPIQEDYLGPGQVPASTEFSIEVPQGHYWVMGDNRGFSADSLYHYLEGEDPFVSATDVVGPVKSVIWPFSHWSGVSRKEAFSAVPNP